MASIVATRAGDLLGTAVKVAFRGSGEEGSGDASARSDHEPEDERRVEKDHMLEAPAEDTDPVRLMAESLGATVVEEYETEDEDG